MSVCQGDRKQGRLAGAKADLMVVIIIDYIVLDDYYQMDFIILSFNYPSTSADSSKPSSSVVHASMLYFLESDLSINGFGRKLNSDADVWKLI